MNGFPFSKMDLDLLLEIWNPEHKLPTVSNSGSIIGPQPSGQPRWAVPRNVMSEADQVNTP